MIATGVKGRTADDLVETVSVKKTGGKSAGHNL